MNDPTYDKKEIEANPVWHLAWFISELVNDLAPVGWGRYIKIARALYKHPEAMKFINGESE